MITVTEQINLHRPIADGTHRIAWLNQGSGSIEVNGQAIELADNCLVTLSKTHIATAENDCQAEGIQVLFEDDDLPGSNSDSVCRIVILYNHISIHNLIKVPSDSVQEFNQLFALIQHESQATNGPSSSSILSLLLQTLLLKVEQVVRAEYLDPSSEPLFEQGVLSQFMQLLESNYTSLHKVKDYANLMNMSTRKLNDVVKHYFSTTAKELISTKLYIELANSLRFGSSSVKEISYHHGFSSPYHMSHFFSKMKGISPQAYRDSFRK